MSDPKHDMKQYYNRRAPEYEQIYYRDNLPRRKEIDDDSERLRALAADNEVLELACGTGYWTQILAATASSIVAVDISREMLKVAAAKTYEGPVTFVQANMFHPPFPEDQFDLLAVGFWLSHQPRERYSQLFDLLEGMVRPNGRIWLIDNNPSAEGPEIHSVRTDENGNHFKRRWLDDGTEFVILKNYFDEVELGELFGTRFDVERLTYGTYYWSTVLTTKS